MFCDDATPAGTITMNRVGGFTGLFSARYSANEGGYIELWDGLNGSGNLLAKIDTNATLLPFSASATWGTASYDLGTLYAHSATFVGVPRHIEYDDVNFATPEPFTLGLGLAGIGLSIRRRRKS
jgi:hypothetical protein